MVKITFPDGSVREYEQGVTGLQIAESISPALARNVVSCGVNGETVELDRPINEDASVELYKFEDEQGKHTFWHTSAHLLAEALQELYPGIQFGFGPAVESGFFYDVMPAEGQVISENDFAKIEAKMMELAKKNEPVVRKEVAKADALAEFKADGQTYKCEHIEQDLEDGTITTYTQGNFTDLCRGPHLLNTGLIKAVKITSVAGAFWRGDAKREQMTRIYGISFPKKKMLDEYLVILEEAKKRDHRKIGKIALGICGDGTILQVLLNVLALVGLTISLELSESISLSHLLANHRFVLLGKFHHLSLNLGEIIL